MLHHGIGLSIRQLKRVLSRRGLRRRNNTSDADDILNAIETELRGSGSIGGYRAMQQRLVNIHGVVVDKETVRQILKIVDPAGVEARSKHRLKRRQYRSKGPNYIWLVDGYDKLKPVGLCIHACIDGYSRRILWLEVGVTNNDPDVTAAYFLDCIRSVGGVPRILRADNGTENVNLAAIQRFFRREALDAFAGEKSFMYGKSVSNQRIEAWWGQLRRGCMDWWISYFKDLRDNGLYCDSDVFHTECLRFCFMPILKEELNKVAILWNLHRIRPSTNPESPPGRPDMLYFMPEINNTRDYKTGLDMDDVDVVGETLGLQGEHLNCSPDFISLANIIMRENGLLMPSDADGARSLYIELLGHIKDVEAGL
ncbi:uncharacterized protein [Montipora foliosa]|uniref:uncharacterized protein n=1 Tax=Montipora foliosa TaxID=591990 RepID=UPI0035F16EB9